ncbi:alpha/beta fold hydrolase [Salirhabdus salicampi]|uniref:alpha/beta fold hydrolase n=1 Tax=Salirhabdus salicampi TaxID=476102 RepID=UPI0020C42721|nr:alpha/beta hydrolase [Salirhabdus salicampi]MCP8616430.1 alpha/beta hydrolase [Salirhabdus salicampi]
MEKEKQNLLNYHIYRKSVHSDWIVFVHGIGGNHKIFYKQIDEMKEHYNLVLLDLPGHGVSADFHHDDDTLSLTCQLIVELLNTLNIKRAHFIGVSLGTIILQYMAMQCPDRFKSMVLAGSVGKWLKWGEMVGRLSLSTPIRKLLPYMVPYVLFAHIVMPKNNHKKSRDIFIREAQKLGAASYIRWAKVARDSVYIYSRLNEQKNRIPKLYISGAEDYMFLKGIKRHVANEDFSKLYTINQCGHVCNIEKYEEFNEVSLNFLKENTIFTKDISAL